MRLERRYESRLIADRVDAVAGAIDRDVKGRPLVVVSILKGAAVFMADLTRRMRGPFACEYLHVRRAEGARGRAPDRLHDGVLREGPARPPAEGRRPYGNHGELPHGTPEGRRRDLPEARGHHRPAPGPQGQRPVDFSLFSSESEELYAGYGMEHDGLHAHLPDIHEVVPEQ